MIFQRVSADAASGMGQRKWMTRRWLWQEDHQAARKEGAGSGGEDVLSWATSSSPTFSAAAAQQSQLKVGNVLRGEVFCAHGCSKGAGLDLAMF